MWRDYQFVDVNKTIGLYIMPVISRVKQKKKYNIKESDTQKYMYLIFYTNLNVI